MLQPATPDKDVRTVSVEAKPKAKPVANVSSKSSGSASVSSKSTVNADKLAEAARLAARKKRLAARRAQARREAVASLEAGRQLLREEQNQSALKAFRESVRLNSNSAEAWMGIAFVCERSGNTKDAVEAFKEAKKLWGM